MKASEVLRRYTAGERDFRRTNLRGQSFKGQDLSGADFSEADLRGANFINAILKNANFTGVKAGLQNRWIIFQWILSIVLSTVVLYASIFQNLYLTPTIFYPSFARFFSDSLPVVTFFFYFIFVVMSLAVIREGLTVKAVMVTAAAIVSAITIGGFTAGYRSIADIIVISIGMLIAISAAIIIASSIIISTIFVSSIVIFIGVFITNFIVSFAIAISFGIDFFIGSDGIIFIFLTAYIIWRALAEDIKFAGVRTGGKFLSSIGGTRFYKSDLTGANFTKATLKSTNLCEASLIQVCWKDAQKLDRARLGNSILLNPAVRELLVTRNGYKKSYVDANLRDANLNGVNLNESNLKWADLSEATLRYADLRGADLSETLVLGTDFKEASLTGTCLEGWNIDHSTNLEGVDCQYVYLLRNQQERRPSSGDFAPGEFTKLFQEVLSTVDLIFRNGVDWKAFVTAFQQVQVENEDTPLEIQSIENKGDGVVVVRVSVPSDTNKEKIHSEFNQQYELALRGCLKSPAIA